MSTLSASDLDLLGPPKAKADASGTVNIAPLQGLGFGGYDGAKRFDRDVVLWQPRTQSADAEMLPDKFLADARARDLLRNDSVIANGVSLWKDSIVGATYMLNAKPDYTALGLDDVWATEFQNEVESKWNLSAESADCWLDAMRTKTFTDMVRLAVGLFCAGGEFLASVEWIRDSSRPFNTAINFIDTDRLSNPMGTWNTANLRAGVVRDDFGAPQGYHIRMGYPAEMFFNPDSWVWKFVPIRKPWGRMQMLHHLDPWRVDQSRGISSLVTALKETRLTKKFRDVTLQNAIVGATFAASIESELPSDAAFASLGSGTPDGFAAGIRNYALSYLGCIQDYSANARNMSIDGVRIPHLFPGTKLQLRPAGTPGGVGTGFEDSLYRYIAAALGVGYEELSKNFSNTNYSSIRAALSQTGRFMSAKKRAIADRFANNVFALWLEEQINAGEITTVGAGQPSFYEGLNKQAYCMADWVGAARGQIDELKETQAAGLRLSFNLSTYEIECARLGLDWRKMLAQRKREQDMIEQLGLDVALSTAAQNTMNAASGTATSGGDKPDGQGDGSGGDK